MDVRLLLIEDSEDDAALVARELRRAGIDVSYRRVQTGAVLREALRSERWDAVVSDYRMPGFGGEAALDILKESGLDLPFLLVSGTVGEEKAVAMMKAGAHDYILKDNLSRLAPALSREIEQAKLRRERAVANEQIRKLSRAVEQNPVSVVITDTAGAIEYVNPKFTAVTGYTLEEVRGLNPRILKSGETPPEVYKSLWETITSGRVWEGDFRNLTKGGDSFWEHAVISPVLDDAGRPTHFLAVKEDITERRRSEARILQLNRLLRTISEVNQLIVRSADRETLLESACRILVEIGGFRMAWIGFVDPATSRVVPAACAGEGIEYLDEVVVRTDDTPEGRGRVGSAIRSGRSAVTEDLANDPADAPWRERHRALNFGSAGTFPIIVRGVAAGALSVFTAEAFAIGAEETALLAELAGDVGYALGALDERVERMRSEEALHRSEQKYRILFENNPQPMWVYDAESLAFLAVNGAAIESYGYTRDEFLGMTLRDIRPPEDVEAFLRQVGPSPPGEASLWRHCRKDGTFIDVRPTSHDVSYDGRPARLVLAHDVTQHLKLEEQLRQAHKMEAVGRLAGGVAHDFNNLLTVIGGYGELLASSLADDPERRESVEEIVKAAGRASALTRQLLAFSRRQPLEVRVVDLRTVVGEAEKMLRRLIGEDIELSVANPSHTALVKIDPGQIEQVLMNLAVNARDAMPKGGRLSITIMLEEIGTALAFAFEAAPPGRYVALTVTDTGAGMDEETRAHIFEPFFTTKDKGKGTGLGLATVFGIVKQSGGFLAVTSEPGRGTTFRIVLPEAEGVPREKRDSGVRSRRGTETILLVEDEAGVRELTRTLLERNGYRVVAADGLDDALAKADAFDGPIHLVLTDVVMPRGTGPELVSALAPRRPEARIVFMSGYASDLLAKHGLADRASGLLQKPFRESDLLTRVREVLDAPATGGADFPR